MRTPAIIGCSLVVGLLYFFSGLQSLTAYYAQFLVSTSTVSVVLPTLTTHATPLSISIDNTFQDYYSGYYYDSGEAPYRVFRTAHCNQYDGDYNCAEPALDLCKYLSMTPVLSEFTEAGYDEYATFPFSPDAIGELNLPLDVTDDWSVNITAPCFEGECPLGYNPYVSGTPLPQSQKGATFKCDLTVESRDPYPVFQVRGLSTVAYAQLATANRVELSAVFTGTPAEPVEPVCTVNCYSNVLFLPGIMGSRLFEESSACGIFNTERERWLSRDDDCDHGRLALDVNGKSVNPLYTKEGDEGVIDDAYSSNLYQSFMNDLEDWKDDDLIADYALLSYDWRLALEDILQNGATTTDGRLSYGESRGFKNSYIYQKLLELQKSSRTGKVTLIGHSNGGLVIKALVQKLRETNDPLYDKIDNIIFVAVPQSGTPEAVSNVLHGDTIGPLGFVMEAERLRDLSQNMPAAYHLLPSTAYFSSLGASVATPVVTFKTGTATQAFINAYGNAITNVFDLQRFLLGADGRATPAYDDLENPTTLHTGLLTYAENLHQQLDDAWEFSASTTVYQIAGWGEGTLASINYRSVRHCDRWEDIYIGGRAVPHCVLWGSRLTFDPDEVIDGDGTVVVQSALAMSTSTERVRRYWVDLEDYNKIRRGNIDRVHKDILEVPELRNHISNIITQSTGVFLRYISTSTPVSTNSTDRLTFTLHSPLTFEFTDTEGRHIGPSTSTPSEIDSTIPGARYKRYGEIQLLTIPKTATGTLTLRGVASGSFTLDIVEMNGNEAITNTSFEGILSATNTVATMPINPTNSPTEEGVLSVDFTGDGSVDETLLANEGSVVTTDSIPPEVVIAFATTTQRLAVKGIDTSVTDIQLSTSSVFVIDQQGNTLHLPLLNYKEKHKSIVLSFNSLVYNGSTTAVATTTIKYKWNTNKRGEYTMFAAYIKSGTTTIETHYRPKKNITVVMTRPVDMDDSENDDDCETRPTKTKIPGMIVPAIITKLGKVEIVY